MAEVLDSYKWKDGGTDLPEEWFDGKIRRITPGEDFPVKDNPNKMRLRLYTVAKRYGLTARVHMEDDGSMVFCAYKKPF